jgi:hypothetical protein
MNTACALAAVCVLLPGLAAPQDLTGTLIGTVRDERGGIVQRAEVRVSSPALIGGEPAHRTDERGQFRFPALPLGSYTLEVRFEGFAIHHEEDLRIGAGTTIDRSVVLTVAGVGTSVVVTGSSLDARRSGLASRVTPEFLRSIPTRRGTFDSMKATPGISQTSQAGGAINLVSAFGSGINENTFLIDGTTFTATSNGVARAEPGVDFVQEIQIQSVGASAEYGNAQGAVVNFVTRQGGERFLYDASYFAQSAWLTSRPVRLACSGCAEADSGYERARYRDFTTTLGGPAVRDRLWFFAGYQHLRDYDSQPGSDPAFPRKYEQDKVFAKLTWRLAPGWNLVQSLHDEFWDNPETPTAQKPFVTTQYQRASVPAVTFGHLTHAASANTVWDVRAGRFVFTQESGPSSGDRTTRSRLDLPSNITSFAPQVFGAIKQSRVTAKATLSQFRSGLLGADHLWKTGVEVDKGQHRVLMVIPGGVRYVYRAGRPSEAVSAGPSNSAGQFVTSAAFASDALTVRDRVTINAGLRFDHRRAISQDIAALDADGRDTGAIIHGAGTLYRLNDWSPRLGVTAKLAADGRTILRASYGRFSQGVMTGELGQIHPGQARITTTRFDPATNDYTGASTFTDPSQVQIDPRTRTPRTDAFSAGIDREAGRRLAVSMTYVHKKGTDFIGWIDTAGQYHEESRTLADSRLVPVFVLENRQAERRFLLTNPDGYSLRYDGLVLAVEKRRSRGWQASGSYTLSRTSGLQSASATTAAGTQVSTVGAPPVSFAPPVTFGRDRNDLTNARGRLPNDRPHLVRVMGSVDIPKTGFAVAANLQQSSGKPWGATATVALLPPQAANQRILLEPRGTRRLSSQSLLDVRVSRAFAFGRVGRIELLLDVLNALNDNAEEGLASDILVTDTLTTNVTFGVPNVFVDPRRAMVSVRLNLGR